MSSPTWTPAEVSRERRRLAGSCWRVVEAQHHVSTMKIVDTVEEQAILEQLLDETKAALPIECRHLHYLLFTPFRYGAPYPDGSRFRRAGYTAGVFYASETIDVAIAEMAFHRLLFFLDAPGVPWPSNAVEHTVFSVGFKTSVGLDLTRAPFARDRERWTDRTDYSACQALADQAREAGADVVRYESARARTEHPPSGGPTSGPHPGINVALLTCRAFASRKPSGMQTWRLHMNAHGVRALGNAPDQRIEFDRDAFADDPRIAALRWDRPQPRS
jgi:hypothetical protein